MSQFHVLGMCLDFGLGTWWLGLGLDLAWTHGLNNTPMPNTCSTHQWFGVFAFEASHTHHKLSHQLPPTQLTNQSNKTIEQITHKHHRTNHPQTSSNKSPTNIIEQITHKTSSNKSLTKHITEHGVGIGHCYLD
jgi:hypothetical protein